MKKVSNIEKAAAFVVMTVIVGGIFSCIMAADVVVWFVREFVNELSTSQTVVFGIISAFGLYGAYHLLSQLDRWEKRVFPDVRNQWREGVKYCTVDLPNGTRYRTRV